MTKRDEEVLTVDLGELGTILVECSLSERELECQPLVTVYDYNEFEIDALVTVTRTFGATFADEPTVAFGHFSIAQAWPRGRVPSRRGGGRLRDSMPVRRHVHGGSIAPYACARNASFILGFAAYSPLVSVATMLPSASTRVASKDPRAVMVGCISR